MNMGIQDQLSQNGLSFNTNTSIWKAKKTLWDLWMDHEDESKFKYVYCSILFDHLFILCDCLKGSSSKTLVALQLDDLGVING